MKKSKLALLLFYGLLVCNSYGQQKKVEDEYAAYFTLPREALYVHLNKTTYFKGEEIWLKSYAYDQKNQLTSKATTNIQVGVYDASGNKVKNALFRAENGVAKGNILIDSTYTAGTYFIKAETNWMQNFEEDNAFVQKIEILTENPTKKKQLTKEEKYDFQFLPEGGNLVANTQNTVGFKVINHQGKGVLAKGVIYNAHQQKITSFESSDKGLGKFLFHPKSNQTYTAVITFESGKEITQPLPKAANKGIALTVTNPLQEHFILNFNTNATTLNDFSSKKYKILIHQNGKQKSIELSFEDAPKKVIRVLKKDLFQGINTITVFTADNTPIIERLIFNDYFLKKSSIEVSKVAIENDSIVFAMNESQLQDNINLSVSVLPEATVSYAPKHNIVSYFYLKPHIKGDIENPQYYFTNMNRKKKYELDILLLTQGWSRYDWKDIFEKKPNSFHRFENGITISGKVNRPAKDVNRLFFYATKNHAAQFIDLNENQEFTLTNLFLEEGEEVQLSYINDKGIFKKPSVYLRFKVSNGKDNITDKSQLETTSTIANAATFTVPENFFYDNSEQLDKVVIKATREREERDPVLVNAKVTRITKEIYERYYNVTDFIQNNGFDVFDQMGDVVVTSRRPFYNDLEPGMPVSPLLFYDDVRMSDFSILSGLSTANVEKIVIDKSGLGIGSIGGSAGVIKIYSRRTPLFTKKASEQLYTSAKVPLTFTSSKKYYIPKYTSYQNNTFQQYGAISWIPEINLQQSQAKNFKIFDTNTKNITLFIEGISESGQLISERKTIQIR
ncbi:hypothetical protein EZY14_007770 [Kordia sp. TARA_039_SRF]|nr:hypothetical protein EZY14_007770 [Kordia sp. TARA_039_SRF]